jgi:hypothetical protein
MSVDFREKGRADLFHAVVSISSVFHTTRNISMSETLVVFHDGEHERNWRHTAGQQKLSKPSDSVSVAIAVKPSRDLRKMSR